MPNHYETLRVNPNASARMIDEAYGALERRITDPDALREIEAAYAVLGNRVKRKDYDDEIAASLLEEAVARQKKIKEAEEARLERLPAHDKKLHFEKENIAQRSTNWAMTYRDLIFPYIGQSIGINTIEPTKFNTARLVDTQQDFFTVSHASGLMHIPYTQILKAITAEGGMSMKSGVFFGVDAKLFIEVFHLVVYKGAVGFSVAV